MKRSLSILGASLLAACTARVSYECKPEFKDDCETVQALRDEIAAATTLPPDPATICHITDKTIRTIFDVFTSHPWREAEDVRENIFEGRSRGVSAVFLPAHPGYGTINGMQCYFEQDHTIRDSQNVACRLDSGATGFTPDISFQATNNPGHLVPLPFYPPSIGAEICSEVYDSWVRGRCFPYQAHLGAKDIDNSEPESAAILDDPKTIEHIEGDRIVVDHQYAEAVCPDIPMDEIIERIQAMFDFVRGKLEGR